MKVIYIVAHGEIEGRGLWSWQITSAKSAGVKKICMYIIFHMNILGLSWIMNCKCFVESATSECMEKDFSLHLREYVLQFIISFFLLLILILRCSTWNIFLILHSINVIINKILNLLIYKKREEEQHLFFFYLNSI